MKKLRAWVKASRLTSQSYIALPLILGQLIALHLTQRWDWWVFVLVQLFGLFDQLYIVYANDYADVETDMDNQTSTLFSGGSRVLVDGGLSREELGRGAWVMALCCAIIGAILSFAFGAWPVLGLVLLGLGLLWAYSYPPIELSYRGGGEFLQMLGVGVVLPLIGYSAQAGTLDGFPWMLLAVTSPLSLATAMCTALPDEPSDRRADKRTSTVLLGPLPARIAILVLNLAGMLAMAFLFPPKIASLELPLLWLLVLPGIATVSLLPLITSASAGTRRVIAYVFFGALANLGLVGGLVVVLGAKLLGGE